MVLPSFDWLKYLTTMKLVKKLLKLLPVFSFAPIKEKKIRLSAYAYISTYDIRQPNAHVCLQIPTDASRCMPICMYAYRYMPARMQPAIC